MVVEEKRGAVVKEKRKRATVRHDWLGGGREDSCGQLSKGHGVCCKPETNRVMRCAGVAGVRWGQLVPRRA